MNGLHLENVARERKNTNFQTFSGDNHMYLYMHSTDVHVLVCYGKFSGREGGGWANAFFASP